MTRKASLVLAIAGALTAILAPNLSAQTSSASIAAQPVSSALNQELAKLFPEIASGYIDLNGNGKADQSADLSEIIAESRVKDGQLQAQEILDFIVANWRFLALDRLRSVQAAVKATPGAINELIAIDFSAALDDAIRQRAAMGDTLYLTPSAYKEAMARMSGIIASMSAAYKKEGAKSESDFIANRDALFVMIERGYPLPDDLPADERATLITAMLSTAMKEQGSNPSKARTAIKALGRLGAAEASSGQSGLGSEAAPYLLGLVDGQDFQLEAIKALGDIGYKPAVPALAKLIKSSKSAEIRKASLLALGAIGGSDGLDAILDLLKPANKAALPKDFLASIAQALGGIAKKGNAEARVQAALKELTTSDDAQARKAATAGMGAFATPASSEALLAVLNADKDPAVRAQAVASLGRQKSDAIAPALIKVLREKDLDPALEVASINALGDLSSGSQAVGLIVDDLADKDALVRSASASALRKLYPANQALVTSALTRSLLASQDEGFLVEGTALLAVLADPSTLPALLTLLQKPQPEVKSNVAWAFYKIRSATNTRVIDELQKLITNESETVLVRVNAVRAAGAIAYDSPQINLWQSLVTTAQMRGEKYAALRYYAVWALGRVAAGKPQAMAALSRIASRDADPELRKQAIAALRDIAAPDKAAIDALAASYAQELDPELKTLIIEALADMGSDEPAALAGDLIAGKAPLALKRRVLSALAESPDEASASALLDASRDPQLQDLAEALLEGYPPSFMKGLVTRRLRTETDKEAISVLEALDASLSQ
jgi:HEAT repeat protein